MLKEPILTEDHRLICPMCGKEIGSIYLPDQNRWVLEKKCSNCGIGLIDHQEKL